jgi:hypothetical protein
VSGVPLQSEIITHGGQPYARDIAHQEQGIGGASNEGIAKRIQDRINIASQEGSRMGGTGQVAVLPSTMGKGAENFAVPTFQTYYDLFNQAEHNPQRIQDFSDAIRGTAKVNQKTKVKTYPFQDMMNLDDPRVVDQFMTNPDMRKAFIAQQQLKPNQKMLGVNAEDISAAHMYEPLVGLPRGMVGHTMLEANPGASIQPSKNVTYSHDQLMNYLGSTDHTPVPVMLHKPYTNIYQEMQAKYPEKNDAALHAMTLGAMERRKDNISQLIDDETINRVGQYHEGLKQGKFDQGDIRGALDYLNQPGIYQEGGEVKKFESGGAAIAKPLVNRLMMSFKDVTKRIPELQKSAQRILEGTGSREEHEALVNQHKPVLPFDFVPTPATREEAVNALTRDKKDLYGVPSQTLQAGHPVGLRLDIPAYRDHGVWVPTIHEQKPGFGAGASIGHESVASVLNPAFGMSEKGALNIAGGKDKATIATIKGDWNPVDQESAVSNAQDYLNHPDWAQVGMDPERHSYFYDRATMEPITHAEEALQIGPLVLAKKPVYGKKEDFQFAAGGLAHLAGGGAAVAKKVLGFLEREANKAKFLEPSAVKDRFYHATGADIEKFQPSHRGAFFATPNRDFANEFKAMDPDAEELKYAEGVNIMPVHIQRKNPFDFDNPEHVDKLIGRLKSNGTDTDHWVKKDIEDGDWGQLENPKIMRAIKQNGHDGFFVAERDSTGEPIKNIAVFEPTQIKSAIGNEGTYDITNPNITKKRGGLI